jgi:hypothetical protein
LEGIFADDGEENGFDLFELLDEELLAESDGELEGVCEFWMALAYYL